MLWVKSMLSGIYTVVTTLVTAAMTLVAAMPHFECRCPDGYLKPFCFGCVSRASGCCCARAEGSSTESAKCCCGRTKAAVAEKCCKEERAFQRFLSSTSGDLARASCCQLTPAYSEPAVFGPSGDDLGTLVFAFALLAQTQFHLDTPVTDATVVSWEIPPPIDLLTVLQRLTI